jgi:hypothetical protein
MPQQVVLVYNLIVVIFGKVLHIRNETLLDIDIQAHLVQLVPLFVIIYHLGDAFDSSPGLLYALRLWLFILIRIWSHHYSYWNLRVLVVTRFTQSER